MPVDCFDIVTVIHFMAALFSSLVLSNEFSLGSEQLQLHLAKLDFNITVSCANPQSRAGWGFSDQADVCIGVVTPWGTPATTPHLLVLRLVLHNEQLHCP